MCFLSLSLSLMQGIQEALMLLLFLWFPLAVTTASLSFLLHTPVCSDRCLHVNVTSEYSFGRNFSRLHPEGGHKGRCSSIWSTHMRGRQLEKRPVTLVINTLSRTERLKSWHFKGPLLSLLWKHKERPRKGESSFYHPFCNRRNFLIVSLILSSHPHWSLRWSSQSLKRPGHRFWFKRYPHWLTACPTRLHVLPPKLNLSD